MTSEHTGDVENPPYGDLKNHVVSFRLSGTLPLQSVERYLDIADPFRKTKLAFSTHIYSHLPWIIFPYFNEISNTSLEIIYFFPLFFPSILFLLFSNGVYFEVPLAVM